MRPNVAVRPAGMARIASSSTKFERPEKFSNGIELLTLKKPPPFVPSILIASCEATGPRASVWSLPVRVVKLAYGPSVWMIPWDTRNSAIRKESGSST